LQDAALDCDLALTLGIERACLKRRPKSGQYPAGGKN